MSVKITTGTKPMETLFAPGLDNLKSPGFWLNGPITIMGSGLGEDDVITFNVVYLKGAERPANDCDCLPVTFNQPSVISETKLMCPECVDEVGFVPVRLTANNPVVILDSPLGQIIQAEYEGPDRPNAHVWVYQGANPEWVSTELKGCPTECCEDLVWYDTGEFRCNIETDTKEIQQVSNCARIRWIDEEPLTWEDTGETRCNIDQDILEVQQVNNCGDLRWVEGPELTWTPTGVLRCSDIEESYEIQEVNNCGDIRWVDGGPLDWIPTGEFRCNTLTDTRDIQERNNCGETRWVETDVPLTWLDTEVISCDIENNVLLKEQRSECGDLRWVEVGPLNWLDTEAISCDIENNALLKEQRSECGDLRWVEVGPLNWLVTEDISCDIENNVLLKEQRSECGDLRWVEVGPLNWLDTEAISCDIENNALLKEQRSECGDLRWVEAGPLNWLDTGNFWCDLESDTQQIERRNDCGETRWFEDGDIVWVKTGETRCLNQIVEEQELNYCGDIRWVATEEKCDFTASFPIPGTCGWGYQEGDNIDPEASVELQNCEGTGLSIWLYPEPRAIPLATIPVRDCAGGLCAPSGEVLGFAVNKGPEDVERCDKVQKVNLTGFKPWVVAIRRDLRNIYYVWSDGSESVKYDPQYCASLPIGDGFAYRNGDLIDPEATERFTIDGITAWAYPTPRPGASIPIGNLYLANTSRCYTASTTNGGGSTSFILDTLEQDAFGEDITYSNSTPTVTGE